MMFSIAKRKFNEDQLELTSAHMGILADLWQKDGVSQQDLAVAIIKDKSTIARAIASMEKNNILVRVPDATDKRSKLIYLTHKGKSLKNQLLPIVDELQIQITKDIPADELNTCLKVLSQIYINLDSSCKIN